MHLVLKELFNPQNILVERQFKIGRYKVDFLVGKKLVVEFDGYRHYSSAKNQARDFEVAKLCEEQGLELMHIPYFIQYPYVCEVLGFFDADFGYKYLNGFIDSKALRPRDFNLQGLYYLVRQLNSYTPKIREEILGTFSEEDLNCYDLIKEMWGISENLEDT